MPSLSPDALAWLAEHHSTISLDRLAQLGVSAHTVRVLRENGTLIHFGRGAYHLGGIAVTERTRLAAHCLMFPVGFVTGTSGGRLFGVRRMTADRRLTFTVPNGRHVRVPPGVVLQQSTMIEPGLDFIERADGIRVATGARLAADLSTTLSARALADVVEHLLSKKLSTPKQLGDMAKRRHNARRPASSIRLARVLLARVPGGPLESGHEVILAQALREAGLPIVAQVRLLQIPDGGPPVRVDLAGPHLRWGIEVDIHPEHALDSGAHDKQRDRRCQLIDWQTSRYTELDFLDVPATVQEIVALYHARIAALAARAVAS